MIRNANQNNPEPHPEPKPETLVPLPDAAPLLGLHYDTARKRLQAGTLRGEKHGGRWLVWVPVEGSAERKSETVSDFIPDVIPDDPESNPDAKPEDSGPIPDQTGTESEQGFRTDSVRNPDALLVQLREEIAFLRQQVERQNHLIAGLIQRVPELPTGDAAVAARDPQHETRPVEPAGDALVPWWKFWERWG